MKKLFLFPIFILTSINAYTSECPLDEKTRSFLINESPYFVDDVRCFNEHYQWNISNKRVMKSPIFEGKSEELFIEQPALKSDPVAIRPVVSKTPEKILIASESKEIQATSQSEESKKPISRGLSFIPGLNEWNTSLTYGAKYLLLSQEGSLLKNADVDVTFFNNLNLRTEFLFENLGVWMNYSSYQFKYESLDQEDASRFSSIELGVSYKWFLASVDKEEIPLFKNSSGDIQMTKMNILSVGVGAKKDFEIPSLSPTFVKLKGIVQYPLQAGTNNTDIKIDSLSGFVLRGGATLTREILNKVNYSLQLAFLFDASYQKLSTESSWGADKGDADTSSIAISSGLGLVFSLK